MRRCLRNVDDKLYQDFKSSGLSIKDYANNIGLATSTFYSRLRVYELKNGIDKSHTRVKNTTEGYVGDFIEVKEAEVKVDKIQDDSLAQGYFSYGGITLKFNIGDKDKALKLIKFMMEIM